MSKEEESPKISSADNPKRNYGLNPDIAESINLALEENKQDEALSILKSLHIADLADFIEISPRDIRQQVINLMRHDFHSEILVELGNDTREEIFDLLGTTDTAQHITNLDTDDAVDIIENLDKSDRQEILDALPKAERAQVEEGLSYPEDSAGRLISKEFVAVPEFWTVGDIIDHLHKENDELPIDFYEVFLVNPKFIPTGGVLLSRIMRSGRDTKLTDIMKKDIKTIYASMDQEEVAFIFRQYALSAAPVVNDEGRMIGVVELGDIVHIIDEEAQEDIMHLGGVNSHDLHSSFLQTFKKRFPWLSVNLITAFISSTVVAFFEPSIEKLAILAALMPVVASMGGNAGTQSVTVAVRALATKELTSLNARRVILKEIFIGIANGLMLALIASTVAYILHGNINLCLVFAAAIIITQVFASVVGISIPLILNKFGIDPAVSSSVFLTTFTDILAFSTFLGIAAYFLL